MEIQSQLTSGKLASLIPSISDSKKVGIGYTDYCRLW